MPETTTTTIKLPVNGSGGALANTEQPIFGLTKVESDRGTVMYVPDPDNDQKTIFWVQGIEGVGGHLAEGEVTLTLTYTGM